MLSRRNCGKLIKARKKKKALKVRNGESDKLKIADLCSVLRDICLVRYERKARHERKERGLYFERYTTEFSVNQLAGQKYFLKTGKMGTG